MIMCPTIGITTDNRENTRESGRYEVGVGYSEAVAAVGGAPVILPHEAGRVADYVALCDGFVFTGGVDPDTAAFGEPVHPKARVMDPARQAFELALFDGIERAKPRAAVLGVCLGMQFMALRAGGRLDQYMPASHPPDVVERHRKAEHAVTVDATDSVLPNGVGVIHSNHQQAVADPGSLRIIARAEDGIIEAVDDPNHPFYVGVQWHPERGGDLVDDPMNWGLFKRLVEAACKTTSKMESAGNDRNARESAGKFIRIKELEKCVLARRSES